MARPRFTQTRLFVEADLGPGAALPLDRGQTNYLVNVMRMKPGAEVLVFNGRDGEWTAAVKTVFKRGCVLEATERLRTQTSPGRITYCFAPLKHARLDYMVQKATEMGAAELQPVLTQHGQVSRINPERMRANVIEACEQCGVLTVPEIRAPLPLDQFIDQWCAAHPDGRIIFCDEAARADSPLETLAAVPSPAPLVLLVGPEGGFSETERAMLNGRDDVLAISLGPRILRADTAAVAALALIQARLGDWKDPLR